MAKQKKSNSAAQTPETKPGKGKTKNSKKSPKATTDPPAEPVVDIHPPPDIINEQQAPPEQIQPEQKDSGLKPQPSTPLLNHGRPPRSNEDDEDEEEEDDANEEEKDEEEDDDDEKGDGKIDHDTYNYECFKKLQKEERKLLPFEDDEDYIFSPSDEEDEEKLEQDYRREDMMYSKIGRALQRAIEGSVRTFMSKDQYGLDVITPLYNTLASTQASQLKAQDMLQSKGPYQNIIKAGQVA
ncbi:MAG: hypothetical protein EZS28_012836 [Streblomastix strix]|uniref:Uncharacterized protein n=1 Tax=Streblomastix strix TaxID=222440 RepID=A0A5J4WAE9_9EUKA|nr:MAG: hypothetical protein EZS28_012836 [Streblomastix strix]